MDAVGAVVVRLVGTPPQLTRRSYRSLVCAMIVVLHIQACAPAPILDSDVVWSAGFETGDLTELLDENSGDFTPQGAGSFSVVTPHAHNGRYSVALTIDTAAWSATGGHAAYLFYWNQLPENEYYYSAWYYIPSGTTPHDWWNIWQWKSTDDGDTDNSWPVFTLNVERESGIRLVHKLPDQQTTVYKQQLASLPIERWFHIEAFYRRAKDESGQVIVWQDNQEIFNVSNVQTALADNTIYWSVNNYTDHITPDMCTIYVDDMAISRIGLGF